ncbi:hypothetical protein BAUCODRAFT_62387 [Baudoinia panamericana UAMH 10762]|uniref:Ribosomal protein S15 n=1 Tax=Baudoinia panamericana (strain UAMH 10762) TaxID=717646 RepID=M2M0E9_BAUPA|nr:uncharacterized protein BAUCODRAFT_62387 [Baudoinia panamericana UAMH 10762]EMD00478.1 hypothetical protein BAUCODRAFT_62387 [Baudoinia panamericana UAMH 10762]
MPPRIPLFQCLRVQANTQQAKTRAERLATRQHTPSRTFTSSSPVNASTVTQRRRKHDPYAIAQAKARKAANLSRQEVLKKERAASLGDPIRGITTPFVQSFDTALPPEPAVQSQSTQTRVSSPPSPSSSGVQSETDAHLNFYLSKTELQNSITHSVHLSTPTSPTPDFQQDDPTSPISPEQRQAILDQNHRTAEEAITRIASLSLGSSKDRLRVNIQRCISTFGRRHTDTTLPHSTPMNPESSTPRIGPDTGSPEVQIAILTAKIRTLADFLGTRGRQDKVNKRNLRVLVHKRQKLLQYLRRQDRGGGRWRHCVETLGLGEGCWRGEISL